MQSFVIGLTLAVTDNIGPLLAVLTFHQTFEGVGLGSRLSMLRLPRKYNFGEAACSLVYVGVEGTSELTSPRFGNSPFRRRRDLQLHHAARHRSRTRHPGNVGPSFQTTEKEELS